MCSKKKGGRAKLTHTWSMRSATTTVVALTAGSTTLMAEESSTAGSTPLTATESRAIEGAEVRAALVDSVGAIRKALVPSATIERRSVWSHMVSRLGTERGRE